MKTRKNCRILIWLTLLLYLCTSLPICAAASEAKDNPKAEEEKFAAIEEAIVGYQEGGTGNYCSYDATDSLVFFAYSDHSSCVNAYNHAGEYQFTINLSYRENGSIAIRCHENKLYVYSKYGNVFIFDGSQCIEKLDADTADQRGYTSIWFSKRTVSIKRHFTKILRYNESGEITDEIMTPISVIWDDISAVVVTGVVVVCIIIRIIREKTKI